MDKNKENFIKNEIFILTILGAFGRNNVYKDNATEKDKKEFRQDIKSLLMKLENKYKNKITESEHLNTLDTFKGNIESKGKNVLKGSSISFGTVQKLLNLYLKYLWCVGLINEPPNCPIDGIILNKIKDRGTETRFTKMNKKDYCDAIKRIELRAGKISVAQWELNEFKRR